MKEDEIFEEWLRQKRAEEPPEASESFTDEVVAQIETNHRNTAAVWLARIACVLAAALLGLLRIEFLTYFIASAN